MRGREDREKLEARAMRREAGAEKKREMQGEGGREGRYIHTHQMSPALGNACPV